MSAKYEIPEGQWGQYLKAHAFDKCTRCGENTRRGNKICRKCKIKYKLLNITKEEKHFCQVGKSGCRGEEFKKGKFIYHKKSNRFVCKGCYETIRFDTVRL